MKASDEMKDPQSQADSEEGRRFLEPFCEPRTMPSNWDVSGLMSAENDRSSRMANTVQPDHIPFTDEPAEEVLPEWQGNPFPKLRTFPSFWDFS